MVDGPEELKPKKPVASKPRKKRKKARRKSRARKAAGKPGRPEFEATKQQRDEVEILIGGGMAVGEIAAAIDVDEKTLRKHFKQELLIGRSKKRAEVLAAMLRAALGGNVSAQKAYLQHNLLAEADDAAQGKDNPKLAETKQKSVYKGKKEVAAEEAVNAGAGTEWGADLEPTTAPPGTKAH